VKAGGLRANQNRVLHKSVHLLQNKFSDTSRATFVLNVSYSIIQ
jgi:hypothetical protein